MRNEMGKSAPIFRIIKSDQRIVVAVALLSVLIGLLPFDTNQYVVCVCVAVQMMLKSASNSEYICSVLINADRTLFSKLLMCAHIRLYVF